MKKLTFIMLFAVGATLNVSTTYAASPSQCGVTDGGSAIRSDAECKLVCENNYGNAVDCQAYCTTCNATQGVWGTYTFSLCMGTDYTSTFYPNALATYPTLSPVLLQTIALNACHAQTTPSQCGVTNGGSAIRSDAECGIVCENDFGNSPACQNYCSSCNTTQGTWGTYTFPLCTTVDYTNVFYPNAFALYPTLPVSLLQTIGLNACHAQTTPSQCGITDGGSAIRSDAECGIVCENNFGDSPACHNYCSVCNATQGTWGTYTFPLCVYPDYTTIYYPNAVTLYPTSPVALLQSIGLNSCHNQTGTTGTGTTGTGTTGTGTTGTGTTGTGTTGTGTTGTGTTGTGTTTTGTTTTTTGGPVGGGSIGPVGPLTPDACPDIDGDGIGDDFSTSFYDGSCGLPILVDPVELVDPIVEDTTETTGDVDATTPETVLGTTTSLNNGQVSPVKLWNTGPEKKYVVTESPSWYKTLDNMPKNLGYWKELMPKELQQDDVTTYIVIPTHGAVIPVAQAQNEQDILDLMLGKTNTVDTYLRKGAAQYPNGATLEDEAGNVVVLGHSSKVSTDSNQFGTVMKVLFDVVAGEQVWIYKVQDDGTIDRFVYQIDVARTTSAKNIEILENTIDDRMLTMITCAPLGSNKYRRQVVATYVSQDVAYAYNYNSSDYSQNMLKSINRSKLVLNTVDMKREITVQSRMNVYARQEDLISLA